MRRIREDGDQGVEFSSGRRVGANHGILGINDDLGVTDGYDGQFGGVFYDDGIHGECSSLTPAEQAELCDYMIDLWQKRKAKMAPPFPKEDDE